MHIYTPTERTSTRAPLETDMTEAQTAVPATVPVKPRKRTTKPKEEKIMTSGMSPFIDTLLDNHKTLTNAYADARKRRIKLGGAMIDDAISAQKLGLELAKTLSEKPSDYKENLTAVIESFTEMQTRTLNLMKLMIAEQTDMREEMLSVTKALLEGSQTSTKAALAMAKSFTTENSMPEMFKKSMDTMKEAAQKMSTAA